MPSQAWSKTPGTKQEAIGAGAAHPGPRGRRATMDYCSKGGFTDVTNS